VLADAPNVWHQRRAQRVRCMPGLDAPARMEWAKRTTDVGEAPRDGAGCSCRGVEDERCGRVRHDVLTILTATPT
jgi:hypothetical protein